MYKKAIHCLVSTALIFRCFSVCIAAEAESDVAAYERKSMLSLRAFECSAVAPDEKETRRLFEIGLKSGREFIAYASKFPEKFQGEKTKVPMLWLTIHGPTPDFVLGQIYANIETGVYEGYDGDEKQWEIKRRNKYRDKNCELLREG